MKKTFTKLALAGILMSATATAQQSLVPAVKSNYVIDANAHATHAKSTAVQSRVIGLSFFNFSNGLTYSLEDTAFLTYTGNRGHDSAFAEIKYDVLTFQTVMVDTPVNAFKSSQSFDGDDRIISNLQQNWNINTNDWDDDFNVDYTYDANNNILMSLTQTSDVNTSIWSNSQKEIYTYDVNNNLLTHITQTWDLIFFNWANSSQNIYEYDVDNNETMHVTQFWNAGTSSWENFSKTTKIYDVNGDISVRLEQYWNSGTSDWENSSQNLYTFDADHHMLTNTYQYNNGGTWENQDNTIYTYTGNDLATMTYQSWNTGTSSWDNDSKELYTYDANHNLVMEINQYYDNVLGDFENDTRAQYTYNSYNQPTSIWSEVWNAGAWEVTTNDYMQKMYYEEYGTNSIAETSAAADFNLYPVPAQSFVRIEKTWDAPQAFTVSVTDLQGRMIRTYNEKATTSYSKNIDVAQLPAGIYVIKIATANGKASYQQFSVMH